MGELRTSQTQYSWLVGWWVVCLFFYVQVAQGQPLNYALVIGGGGESHRIFVRDEQPRHNLHRYIYQGCHLGTKGFHNIEPGRPLKSSVGSWMHDLGDRAYNGGLNPVLSIENLSWAEALLTQAPASNFKPQAEYKALKGFPSIAQMSTFAQISIINSYGYLYLTTENWMKLLKQISQDLIEMRADTIQLSFLCYREYKNVIWSPFSDNFIYSHAEDFQPKYTDRLRKGTRDYAIHDARGHALHVQPKTLGSDQRGHIYHTLPLNCGQTFLFSINHLPEVESCETEHDPFCEANGH